MYVYTGGGKNNSGQSHVPEQGTHSQKYKYIENAF